jgi:Holliday junction resolvase RusA-like endonuclease
MTDTQSLAIEGWLPAPNANVSADNWRKRQKRLKAAQVMVWAAAKQAGWIPLAGRARVTVTLVFGQQRRRDVDNLYARCKGLIDGIVKGGWITDDSSDVLDLKVLAEVSREWTGTKITLEALS